MNKYNIIILLLVIIQKCLCQCNYLNPLNPTQNFDMISLKLNKSLGYKVSALTTGNLNSFIIFNLCNETTDLCNIGFSNLTACQSFASLSTINPLSIPKSESHSFLENGLIIKYSIDVVPTPTNNCSAAIEPNKRVTFLNFNCNKSVDNLKIINGSENSRCSYQVNLETKLVCKSCPINCTQLLHSINCNETSWKCNCDSQTYGDYCNQSKIYISSVDSTTTDGGTTFLNGYFGNTISGRLNITIGSLQCNNITVYNTSTISCNIEKGEGVKPVTLIDRDLICTGTFQYISIKQPCLNDCFSIKNGICDDRTGVCACNQNFTGYDCGTLIQNEIPKTVSIINNWTGVTTMKNEKTNYLIGIHSLVEFDFSNSIVNEFFFNRSWNSVDTLQNNDGNTITTFSQVITQVNCTIEYSIEEIANQKSYSFAGVDFNLLPGSIKLKISIKGYKFSGILNTLQLRVLSSSHDNTSTTVNDDCNFEKVDINAKGLQNDQQLLNYITISKDSKKLSARFINKVISDGKTNAILNSIVSQETDSIIVGLNLPHCVEECIIDPDFSVLVSSQYKSCSVDQGKAKWFLPVVIAVPTFGLSLIAMGSYIYYKRNHVKFTIMWNVKLKSMLNTNNK
ncbi:hypothetical protein ACTA71_009922 [Dictyostelium dimigraforme]